MRARWSAILWCCTAGVFLAVAVMVAVVADQPALIWPALVLAAVTAAMLAGAHAAVRKRR